MTDTQTTVLPHLEVRWLPVTDESGREHLRAVWIEVAPAPAIATPHAA